MRQSFRLLEKQCTYISRTETMSNYYGSRMNGHFEIKKSSTIHHKELLQETSISSHYCVGHICSW